MSASQYLYKRFDLPSGTVVEVRKITEGTRPEVVVREVSANDEISLHEYSLRLDFLLQRARMQRHG